MPKTFLCIQYPEQFELEEILRCNALLHVIIQFQRPSFLAFAVATLNDFFILYAVGRSPAPHSTTPRLIIFPVPWIISSGSRWFIF